jgi:outer membrane protein TolC
MQGVRSAAEMLQLKGEHLAEAREDLAFRQRQYAAGLATELQVQETFLSVQRAEDDYAHSKLLYAQSVLALWNLCGRDLRTLVFAVIN